MTIFLTVSAHYRLKVWEVSQCNVYFMGHVFTKIRLPKQNNSKQHCQSSRVRRLISRLRYFWPVLTLGSIFSILLLLYDMITKGNLTFWSLPFRSTLNNTRLPVCLGFMYNLTVVYDAWWPIVEESHMDANRASYKSNNLQRLHVRYTKTNRDLLNQEQFYW